MSEWKLVPVEPTEEMLEALGYMRWITSVSVAENSKARAAFLYRKLLATAPPAPTTDKEKALADLLREADELWLNHEMVGLPPKHYETACLKCRIEKALSPYEDKPKEDE